MLPDSLYTKQTRDIPQSLDQGRVNFMRIAELENKYKQFGLDKRTIDYYSSPQVGLIPYTREEGSNYRIYGDDAEALIKKIIILRDVGLSSKKIKEALDNPSYFTTAMWNEHIESLKAKLAEVQKHYEEMIQYAQDMRDSSSLSLNLVGDIDDPKAVRALTHMYARIQKYIISPDTLTELSENLDEDLSDFSNCCVVFLKSIEKKREQGLSADSPEVLQSVEKFIQRIKGFFGIAVFLVFQFSKKVDSSLLGLNEEEAEEYTLAMQVFEICANWFRDARTAENALDFDKFAESYGDRIKAIDQEIGESTFDDMTDVIKEICELPLQITTETMEKLKSQFDKGIDAAAISHEASKEEIDEAKADMDFIFQAINHYVSIHQKP